MWHGRHGKFRGLWNRYGDLGGTAVRVRTDAPESQSILHEWISVRTNFPRCELLKPFTELYQNVSRTQIKQTRFFKSLWKLFPNFDNDLVSMNNNYMETLSISTLKSHVQPFFIGLISDDKIYMNWFSLLTFLNLPFTIFISFLII